MSPAQTSERSTSTAPAPTSAPTAVASLTAAQLARRLERFEDGLATLPAEAPCPWTLALLYNTMLRLCKPALSTQDPIVRGFRVLVERHSDSGLSVADQSVSTVRTLTQQIIVALQDEVASTES